jgi:hypothetical protein
MDCCDGFIGTFSGLRFWPLDPNPEKILIEDIAHALAHQCRFGGLGRKELFDEESAQGLVLPLEGLFWGKEEGGSLGIA